jgi:hypothetical protein
VYIACRLCLLTVAAAKECSHNTWVISKIDVAACQPCRTIAPAPATPAPTAPAPTAPAPTAPAPAAPAPAAVHALTLDQECFICCQSVSTEHTICCSKSSSHIFCLGCFERSVTDQVQAFVVYTRPQSCTRSHASQVRMDQVQPFIDRGCTVICQACDRRDPAHFNMQEAAPK